MMGYSFLVKARNSFRNASAIIRSKARFCSAVKMGLRPRVLFLEGDALRAMGLI